MNVLPPPRLLAWEITRNCNLYCAHCRASAVHGPCKDELSTAECFSLIDDILNVGKPIIILTGGEPLMRADFFEIAKYAADKGLKVVSGTNGTLITEEAAARMKAIPIVRLGISVDFPAARAQDKFRGKAGAFDGAMEGIKNARKCGIEVQINSTITKLNVSCLDSLLALALDVGAAAFHPFLLVPTGRGKELKDQELPADEYERVLNWICDKQEEFSHRISIKPTDAPHYMRVVRQRSLNKGCQTSGAAAKPPLHKTNLEQQTRGCLAGTGFCFISHVGQVQGCGYLDIEAGNIRKQSFSHIWQNSPLFADLRDLSLLKGKCGICEYKKICGGCRARAYERTGDYLAEEPYCVYQPAKVNGSRHH